MTDVMANAVIEEEREEEEEGKVKADTTEMAQRR